MLKIVEAFSGIGSQAKALKNLGIEYDVINIVEWDISAFMAYDIIHNGKPDITPYEALSKKELIEILSKLNLSLDGKKPIGINTFRMWNLDTLKMILAAFARTNNLWDIRKITAKTFPEEVDILTYSFPCQDLSVGGAWHGNLTGINRDANNRSGLLWEVERILLDLYKNQKNLPRFLLMENVSNILSKRHKVNFIEWQERLEELGYFNMVYTLNASNFGVPQTRVRTFMISVLLPEGKKKRIIKKYFDNYNLEKVYKQYPVPLKSLADFLRVDYSIKKYKEEADKSNPNNTKSRQKIYDNNELIYKDGNIIKNFVGTLTTKQDRNPNPGILEYPIHKIGRSIYRNLTPRECFLLMGFSEQDFDRVINYGPRSRGDISFYGREKLERLAGNSIVVAVLEKIFEQIIDIKNLL